jgi:hypothetical protein
MPEPSVAESGIEVFTDLYQMGPFGDSYQSAVIPSHEPGAFPRKQPHPMGGDHCDLVSVSMLTAEVSPPEVRLQGFSSKECCRDSLRRRPSRPHGCAQSRNTCQFGAFYE